MYPESMFLTQILKVSISRMKFSIFTVERLFCILHGIVFVMRRATALHESVGGF